MKSNLLTRGALIAAVSGMALSMTACGSDEPADTASTPSSAAETTSESESSSAASSSAAPSASESATAAGENFGSGCAAVPAEGPGSFQGMSTAPVATAASANPVLSTLVSAVTAAGLVDTLNSAQDITVFAPANPAFEAIPADTLNSVLADVPMLTTILTHHVVQGRVAPDALAAGPLTTLAGDTITVTGSGEEFSIAADQTVLAANPANVICGNVQTANATVYIIDQVLAPAAA